MKSIKRIIALLLTAVMTMTMSVTAFAAGPTNCSLTVNVLGGQEGGLDLKGQTINLYKLFDVTTSQSNGKTNYAYTVNDTYKSTLAATLKVSTDAKNEDFVKNVNDLNKTAGAVQNFANDFTAKALTSNLEATATSGKIKDSSQSYTFNNLAAGYYLVYLKCGKEIQSSLVTVDGPNITVNLKTEAPSITKKADKDTVSIGQVVTYTVTGSVPDTTGYSEYVYKIHDTLTNGLDFVNDANGTALETGATKVNVTVAFKDTSVNAGTAPTTAALDTINKRKMSLDLSEWVRANQTNKGKEFTVTYYAKVNDKAVVTEKNSATLEYGNNPSDTTTTTPSEAKTPTYPLDIKKYAKTDNKMLAGAIFKLYKDSVADENVIKVTGSEGNYVVDPASTTTEFVSVDSITGVDGYNLHVNGLAAGTYYLVETEAPAGYNKLTAPIKVVITKDGDNWTISKDGTPETDKIIDVENSTGSILPSTGGMGTIAFTVVAALLVLGVAVSFIRDRKREN
ncbi:SpaH/EbpB family LPXTG-anchored major pilin [Catenibacterium sp.]|uniref:SpaH/EbpB family LPXTG-anchored major pilin n=1 Tax=Catenibacterium sp. TaxID=2049022 RepID=UPI003AB55D54